MRIAFVHNQYIAYRKPLFKKLAQIFDSTFLFDEVSHKTKPQKNLFLFKILRSVPIPYSSKYRCTFSPGIFYHLLRGKFNCFIGSDLGQPATYITFIISKMLRKPFILWSETWYWPKTTWRLLMWPIINILVKNASAIVVPGLMSKRFFLSIIPRGEEKIFTAPNTSILPQSKDYTHRVDVFRKKLNLDNKKVILFVGRLVTQKGIDYLLEAFTKLQKTNNDVALIVVGGPVGDLTKYEPEELLAKCRAMGVENTYFPGWVYGEDKTIYFMLANVVVLPSIFFSIGSEVWGLVLNEAMSVGKPIIATYAVGAAYDLIENGVNGYIVPDKDSEALYKSIKAIIDNPSTEKNFGEKSKEILLGKFTYEHMCHGFINAVEYAIRDI